MFHAPKSDTPVPLVVALHSWSADYKQRLHRPIEQWCVKQGWAYIHPNFRGPNRRPEATGSDLVVKDIESAVAYAKKQTAIDASAVYLVGTSGGGYTALVMAGQRPTLWAGVSAWVPISDLTAWYHECKKAGRKYYREIAASCGGAPGDSAAVDKQFRQRSPITYLAKAKGVRLHIHAGVYDGHKGSVPISHSLRAFNEVAEPDDRVSNDDIEYFVEHAKAPPGLAKAAPDPAYGKKQPLFRRTSGETTVTIFDGGHELIAGAAIAWIEATHKDKHDQGAKP